MYCDRYTLNLMECKVSIGNLSERRKVLRLGGGLFDPSHHGFIGTGSCSTCLIVFFNEVTRIQDQKNLMIILYFDIKEAFDKAPHKLLIIKIQSVAITNPQSQWNKSLLTNRCQGTKIKSTTSAP